MVTAFSKILRLDNKQSNQVINCSISPFYSINISRMVNSKSANKPKTQKKDLQRSRHTLVFPSYISNLYKEHRQQYIQVKPLGLLHIYYLDFKYHLFLFKLFYLKIIYVLSFCLKDRMTESGRSSISASGPDCSQWPRLSRADTKKAELSWGLSHRWQEPST